MSKVKKIAEEFLAKYPTLFSANFEANKKALDQIAVIRNRALRNQIAGAITAMAADLIPATSATSAEAMESETQTSSSETGPVATEAQ